MICYQELSIDIAKTHLWMKRVSNLLGEDYAQELAATYVTYTLPHTEEEKEEMIEMKHHQLFTKEFNRSLSFSFIFMFIELWVFAEFSVLLI